MVTIVAEVFFSFGQFALVMRYALEHLLAKLSVIGVSLHFGCDPDVMTHTPLEFSKIWLVHRCF